MSPLLVPRLEAKDGNGPFTTVEKRPYAATARLKEMPTPWNDYAEAPPETCSNLSVFNCFHDHWFCGFFGPDKLAEWVTADELKRFKGFYLKTYMVPPGCFKAGLEQVMFDKAEAILIEEEWLGDAEVESDPVSGRSNSRAGIFAGYTDPTSLDDFRIYWDESPTLPDRLPTRLQQPLYYLSDSEGGAQRGQPLAGSFSYERIVFNRKPADIGWLERTNNENAADVQRRAKRVLRRGWDLAE